MPAIWASSERPISVRTVWVDGIRHAILSPDDPFVNPQLQRRTASSKIPKRHATKYEKHEPEQDRLNNHIADLHVIVKKKFPEKSAVPETFRRLSPSPTTGVSHVDENILYSLNRVRRSEDDFLNVIINYPIWVNHLEKQTCVSSDSSKNEDGGIQPVQDTHLNPLSERVLQWLGLSGKSQDFEYGIHTTNGTKSDEEKCNIAERIFSSKKCEEVNEKCDNSLQESATAIRDFKLQTDEKLECLLNDDRKTVRKCRDETVLETNEFRKCDQKYTPLVDYRPANLITLPKVGEVIVNEDCVLHNNVSRVWPSAGRMKLHITIPSLHCKEKHTSSQESLIYD